MHDTSPGSGVFPGYSETPCNNMHENLNNYPPRPWYLLRPGADLWIVTVSMDGTDVLKTVKHYRFLDKCRSFHEGTDGRFASYDAWLVTDDDGMVIPINPLLDIIYFEEPNFEDS